jgi:hypothetical protein
MKTATTITVLAAACAVFVLSPYLPQSLLKFTVGNMVGSAALLLLVLYVIRIDAVLGLAVFLAVAALFLENRRRTVDTVREVITNEKTSFRVEGLDKPAPPIVPGEVHPAHREPDIEDHGFEPTEDSGQNTFEKVDYSQDEKQPLETVPPQPNEVSELLQEKGLANIS